METLTERQCVMVSILIYYLALHPQRFCKDTLGAILQLYFDFDTDEELYQTKIVVFLNVLLSH
jgi:hypothetical protein